MAGEARSDDPSGRRARLLVVDDASRMRRVL
jgi:hypothetical protein